MTSWRTWAWSSAVAALLPCSVVTAQLPLWVAQPPVAARVDSLWYDLADTTMGRQYILIHLDSLRVIPSPAARRQGLGALRDSLVARGLRLAYTSAGGTLVFGWDVLGGAARDSAFLTARRLRAELQAWILQAGPAVTLAGPSSGVKLATDEVVVRFLPTAASATVDAANSACGTRIVHSNPFRHREYLVQAMGGDGIAAAGCLQRLAGVLRANPNFRSDVASAAAAVPDYPRLQQWYLDRIAVSKAWEVTTGNLGVVVAVLEVEGGFDITHPDLEPRLVTDDPGNVFPGDVAGWNFTDCVSDPSLSPTSYFNAQAADGLPGCGSNDLATGDRSHATHVAGVIAADAGGTSRVVGVCPGCKLLLLVETGGNDWAKELALQYAVDRGARVINGSWQTLAPLSLDLIDQYREAASKAVVVQAASNYAPASCDWNLFRDVPELLVIGATDVSDNKREGAEGACLDIVAPGRQIGTLEVSGSGITNNFGQTSAATAIVSGVAGLLLSADPSLSAAGVRNLLTSNADQVHADANDYTATGRTDSYGYGRVNACRAVRAAEGLGDIDGCETESGLTWFIEVVLGAIVLVAAVIGRLISCSWLARLIVGIVTVAVVCLLLYCVPPFKKVRTRGLWAALAGVAAFLLHWLLCLIFR